MSQVQMKKDKVSLVQVQVPVTSNKGEIGTRVLERKSGVEGVGWDCRSKKGGRGEEQGKEREEDGTRESFEINSGLIALKQIRGCLFI